jgi:hypothetical protein
MNLEQLENRIDKAWTELRASFDGLSEARMTAPAVMGDWSVKDNLAHVTIWEEEALKTLPIILQGGAVPRYSVLYGGIDAFNALMIEEKRGLSLPAVLEQLDYTHLRLIEYIRDVPEDNYVRETRFRRRLRLDTYSHYPLHARAIRDWREESAW